MTSRGGSHAASGSFARDVAIRVGRAVVLVVVVVVLAFVVFRATQGSNHHNNTSTATTLSSLPSASVPASVALTTVPVTSTTVAPATTSTTLVKPAPASVSVVVLNGTSKTGAAGYFTDKLHNAGYQTLPPLDASASTATSSLVIVTATGTRAAGEAVAASLGLGIHAVITAVPAAAPIPAADLTASNVVVLIGADISGQAPVVATPPTDATTTTT